MKLYRIIPGLDQLGMTASTLCALHCLLVPLLLTALPFAGLAFLVQPWIDIVTIAAGLLIGGVSLGISYTRHHRRILPLLLLIAGFTVIGAVHLMHAHPGMAPNYGRLGNIASLPGYHPVHTLQEMIFLFAGGLCVAAGHLVNWRYNRRCGHREHRVKDTILHIVKRSA